MTIQDIRRRVLELEGKTLVDYAQNDDPAFSDAIDLILQSKGRVIVSGMGKSHLRILSIRLKPVTVIWVW
jgi:D-arabinose 5-phosphate isomerase GutQ